MSSELEGDQADLRTITTGNAAGAGPAAQSELLALVQATLDPALTARRAEARTAVANALGAQALVEAAAVIGNFQRMTRIADATGITLDEPVAAMTAGIREELGLNELGAGRSPPRVGWLKRRLYEMVQGLMLSRVRKRSTRTPERG